MPKVISRRSVLRRALLVPLGAALSGPGAIARATTGLVRSRPNLTHGIAAGDAHADGALVWARSDVPATMIVETAATESFANPVTVRGPLLTPDTDGTGRVRITGLEPGSQVHYRVTLEGAYGARGEPLTGVFTTAPVTPADVKFLWSGDVVGQGWGINSDTGGMTVWSVMADRNPDFFIHSGDAIYADNPVEATQKQNDGRTYHNVTAPGKAQVAQTLAVRIRVAAGHRAADARPPDHVNSRVPAPPDQRGVRWVNMAELDRRVCGWSMILADGRPIVGSKPPPSRICARKPWQDPASRPRRPWGRIRGPRQAGSTDPITRCYAKANRPSTRCPWVSPTSSTFRPASGGWPAGAPCSGSSRSRSVATTSTSERIRLPWWLKYVNMMMIGLQKLGVGFGGKGLVVLTVVGRKSGKPRSTPVTPMIVDDRR